MSFDACLLFVSAGDKAQAKLPPTAFATYMKATGGIKNNKGVYTITPKQFAKLQTLYFNIGGSKSLLDRCRHIVVLKANSTGPVDKRCAGPQTHPTEWKLYPRHPR